MRPSRLCTIWSPTVFRSSSSAVKATRRLTARFLLARTALLSDPKALLRDPMHAGGMFVLKGVEGAGLVMGMRDERKRVKAGS